MKNVSLIVFCLLLAGCDNQVANDHFYITVSDTCVVVGAPDQIVDRLLQSGILVSVPNENENH